MEVRRMRYVALLLLVAAVLTGTALPGAAFQGDEEDWGIVRDKARWAYRQGLDTLPIGQIIARIGETFVGTEYAAHTLEVPGEERLVIELNRLDCVTFVENALALARLVQSVPETMLDDVQGRYRFMYAGILSRIRYRGGEMERYPSRLHYFSEWITDKDEMGIVRDVSRELGGLRDTEPIDFMTTHAGAYRQLGETPEFVDEMRAVEARLSGTPRFYIPEDRIAEAAGGIQTGDIIAATSTVEGLDIAHTGIAVWMDGELRLLHAPLAEGTVRISERSLAQRIREIAGQDGIMVARPVEAR
jgi:N-acetylmuramoyl-L-alanine amidase-like protein